MTSLTTKLSFLYRRLRALIGRPLLLRQRQVVIEDGSSECLNPVLILGCHRSGTTLLRRMVNSHPELACPPETNYLGYFAALAEDDVAREGLLGMIDPSDLEDELRRWALRYHEAFRISEGKTRWADKSPKYLLELDSIQKILPPETQMIALIRDPYDVFTSIYSRGWDLWRPNDSRSRESRTAEYVERCMLKLLELTTTQRAFEVRYDQLVDDPEATTRAICQFIGEDWSERMIKPWQSRHNFGTEDPIARASRSFRKSSGNWHALPPDVQSAMRSNLESVRSTLGYK